MKPKTIQADFYTPKSGITYYFPRGMRGRQTAEMLRVIADKLDRVNAERAKGTDDA